MALDVDAPVVISKTGTDETPPVYRIRVATETFDRLQMTPSGVYVGDGTVAPTKRVGTTAPNTYTQTYSTANRTVAAQTAETLTDSTTGTAANTLAAGVGIYNINIPIHNLATVADGDVLTTYLPGHKFKILAFDTYVTNEVTTGSKLSTLNLEIDTTDVTGGAVALTSANCATLGAKVAGSAVTAANTGTSAQTISIEAASTTAFSEGGVVAVIRIQNMDTADAFASLVDEQAKLKADDLDNRQTVTAIIDDLQLNGLVL